MPVLNETPVQIGVLVKGVNEGGLSNATPDSEFDICDVSLYTSYMPFGRYTAPPTLKPEFPRASVQ